MIKIIVGSTLIGGKLISAGSTVSTDAKTEANLVARGVAEWVGDPPDIPDDPTPSGGDDEPAGAGLPAVTGDDNGKVLGVVNGAWDKTEVSGGNDDFPVTATLGTDGDNMTISDLSKSVGEIYAAYSAGKKVHLVMDGSNLVSGMDLDIPLTQIIGDDVAVFGGNISGAGMATGLVLVMWDGDDASISLYIPQGSASNDYKVTLTATVDEQTQQAVITADKTVAEIYAAAVAGKHIFAVVEIVGGAYQRYELYLYTAVKVTFYGVEMDEDGSASTAKPVVIEGAATGGDHDEWTVID